MLFGLAEGGAMNELVLSDATMGTAGILLLAVVTIEYGGWYLTQVARGRHPLTAFQKSFARAGHGHAGVLVILSLVALIYADAADIEGIAEAFARSLIPAAAILMPAGFFFSSSGRETTSPNRLVVLVYAGAVCLALGVVSLGLALLST
jgi:hypothetical protein